MSKIELNAAVMAEINKSSRLLNTCGNVSGQNVMVATFQLM